MSVKALPRLILRWHRASPIYKKIKSYRTSSEKSNSTCKENELNILECSRLRGIKRAAVLSYLSDIASFLKRVFGLIIVAAVNFRKYRGTREKRYWEKTFWPQNSSLPSLCYPERIKSLPLSFPFVKTSSFDEGVLFC